MSRPQNAPVAAPERPVSPRTTTNPTRPAKGAHSSAGLTGTCKLCGLGMELLGSGFWIHQGTGYIKHWAMVEERRTAVAREAHSGVHSR